MEDKEPFILQSQNHDSGSRQGLFNTQLDLESLHQDRIAR